MITPAAPVWRETTFAFDWPIAPRGGIDPERARSPELRLALTTLAREAHAAADAGAAPPTGWPCPCGHATCASATALCAALGTLDTPRALTVRVRTPHEDCPPPVRALTKSEKTRAIARYARRHALYARTVRAVSDLRYKAHIEWLVKSGEMNVPAHVTAPENGSDALPDALRGAHLVLDVTRAGRSFFLVKHATLAEAIVAARTLGAEVRLFAPVVEPGACVLVKVATLDADGTTLTREPRVR